MGNYNATLITKESKGSPVSDGEMDDNFVELLSLATVAPEVDVIGDFRYLENTPVNFNIQNFDEEVLYAINSNEELDILPNGNFEVIPSGSGLSLFAMSSNKLPNAGKCILEEHREIKKYVKPTSVDFGEIVSDTLVNCFSGGEYNVAIWEASSPSISLMFVLTFVLSTNNYSYGDVYQAWLSSPSKLMFTERQLPNEEYWMFCSYDNIDTIVTTDFLIEEVGSTVFDVFGDGSALEYFRMYNNMDNFDGSNSFTGDALTEFRSLERFTYMNYLRNMTNETYLITTQPLSLSGNVPASFSIWLNFGYAEVTRRGYTLSYGEVSQRYNLELQFKPIAGKIEVSMFFHKRSQVMVCEIDQVFFNCLVTYESGVFELLIDGISKGTITANANWNDSKGIEVIATDFGDSGRVNNNTGFFGHLRIFNKKVSAVEIGYIQDEGYKWVYVDPPLPCTPSFAYYGTIPKVFLDDIPQEVNIGNSGGNFTLTLPKEDTGTGFKIRAEFKNGLDKVTTFKGYFEYTQAKN